MHKEVSPGNVKPFLVLNDSEKIDHQIMLDENLISNGIICQIE